MVLVEVVSHLPQKLLERLSVVCLDIIDLVFKILNLDLDDFGKNSSLAVDALPLAVVVQRVFGE